MQELDDTQLAKRAANGDAAAFSRLLERHYMTIYRFAYKWTGARADAQDVAQEVCLKLARALGSFHAESSFTTWLYRVVVNAAKDFHTSRKRRTANESAFAEHQDMESGAHTQEDAALAGEIFRAIHQLPEVYRDAVLLVMAEGISHKQAGEILGCAEGTISWRISEAKKQLQGIIEGKSIVMPSL